MPYTRTVFERPIVGNFMKVRVVVRDVRGMGSKGSVKLHWGMGDIKVHAPSCGTLARCLGDVSYCLSDCLR